MLCARHPSADVSVFGEECAETDAVVFLPADKEETDAVDMLAGELLPCYCQRDRTGLKSIRNAGREQGSASSKWASSAPVRSRSTVQPIHPTDSLSSVTTTAWAILTPIKTVMCLFFLLGITGLYARQVNKAGWPGLAGYLLFSLSWTVNLVYTFAEAFILPPLASVAPNFV